uniref:Uncharacterized protein n=1 Tax=Ascaris lumbricoides TaxID=6252 RepID=A0A0M3HZN1_ASCLU
MSNNTKGLQKTSQRTRCVARVAPIGARPISECDAECPASSVVHTAAIVQSTLCRNDDLFVGDASSLTYHDPSISDPRPA